MYSFLCIGGIAFAVTIVFLLVKRHTTHVGIGYLLKTYFICYIATFVLCIYVAYHPAIICDTDISKQTVLEPCQYIVSSRAFSLNHPYFPVVIRVYLNESMLEEYEVTYLLIQGKETFSFYDAISSEWKHG